MNTDFISKPLKKHRKKASAAAGGLSVGLLIFLYERFATKEDLKDHCQDCKVAHAEHWRTLQDHELDLDRIRRIGFSNR